MPGRDDPQERRPPPPSDFAARLKQRYGADVDPEVSLDRPSADAPSSLSSELLTRLAEHSLKSSRYRLEGEIARGGMGAILKVWDEDLRRTLAMKVVLGKAAFVTDGGTPPVDARTLGRFLEEAQITGQLDHPGIAPVHELGLDSDGRVYFTMRFVKGRDSKHIFNLVFEGHEGWNETRALSVLLKVCEAVAFAHTRGVIHRDLKPANVMVGSFGEVYVMDWGLARVLGRKDSHDLRLRDSSSAALSAVTTQRREEAPDSPLVTMDGDVVGTPAYMPPEQARGEIENLSARSDVYAIGAMLYHLLARQMPFVPPFARVDNHLVLRWVLEGPPVPLHELRTDLPAELVAICEKAMSRDAAQRYADTLALAEDLRAYLEHRVVTAYETGAVAELRKWVARNRALAAASAAALLLAIGGLVAVSYVQATGRKEADAAREIARRNAQQAAANEERAIAGESQAKHQEQIAKSTLEDVLSLSALQELSDLEAEADRLWPADPDLVPRFDAWLERARLLIDGRAADPARGLERRFGLADHKTKLAEIRLRAKVLSQVTSENGPEKFARDEHASSLTDGRLRDAYEFDDGRDRWWNAQLTKLVTGIESFQDAATGLYSRGSSREHSWGIVRRREFAAQVAERSLTGADAQRRWREAIAAIGASAKYGGLVLTPQLGLFPIGADPASGLWEFAHLATGEIAERGAGGKLVLKEDSGLVLVLIPGGIFMMGAQSSDPNGPNFDPAAEPDETPHDVTLDAYFLSKYEMTQGQWLRAMGVNPSFHHPARYDPQFNRAGAAGSLLFPADDVSWNDCARMCERMGLVLPTEAQWECACRAGTETPFWSGDYDASLAKVANVGDAWAGAHGGEGWTALESWDDGNSVTAAVGSYLANGYGLHDTHGNVWEWCRDHHGEYTRPWAEGDGERQVVGEQSRVNRGGGYNNTAQNARSANRSLDAPTAHDPVLGLRPARSIRNTP